MKKMIFANTRVVRGFASLAAAMALLLTLVATPGGAMAHAELESSTPAAGATVPAGLTEVTMNFTEELNVDQATAALMGPGGAMMSGATASVDRANRKMMVLRTSVLGAGQYTVKITAASIDGHIEEISLQFTVAGGEGGMTSGGTSGGASGGGDMMGQGGNSSLPSAGAGDSMATMVALLTAALMLLTLGTLARSHKRA